MTSLSMVIENLVFFAKTMILIIVWLRVSGTNHTFSFFDNLMILAEALFFNWNKVSCTFTNTFTIKISISRARNAVIDHIREYLIIWTNTRCLIRIGERVSWTVNTCIIFFYLIRLAYTRTTDKSVSVFAHAATPITFYFLIGATCSTGTSNIICVARANT